MIDEHIVHLILANVRVIEYINGHVYPGIIPEDHRGPALRYVVNDRPSEWTGSGVESEKLADVQIDIFHPKYTTTKSISNKLIDDFHLYKGQYSGPLDNTRIHHSEVLDSTMLFDKDTREYRITLTLLIKYQEI